MIRRHVLAAVAVGVAAGDDDAARAALGKIDWVLRGRARIRLEHALIDATLATGVHAYETADDARHLLRAAALVVEGRRDVELADRAQVASAYREVTPLRVPVATIVAAIAVAATATALGAVAVSVVTAHGPPGAYTRPDRPPPVGAFRDGGIPARDPAIEHVLVDDLPKLVIATDAHSSDATTWIARLRDAPAFRSHGPALASAWRAMIDATQGDPRDVRVRVDVVSDRLAAAGLGYYLDAELIDGRRAPVFSYRVEDVVFVRAGDDRARVLELRRLDRLNISLALLGMKPEQMSDPVVLLDQLDEHVAGQIVPVLDGAPYGLADDGWDRTPRGRAATTAAGDAIRRELLVALGADRDDAARAIARCRKLFAASVRHHEAQHAFDAEHRLAEPSVLAGLGKTASALRTRAELSAYTSQIASDVWLPQLALWNLARHGLRSYRSTPEAVAAAIVIEGLARRLAIAIPAPVIHDGVVDRERLAALIAPLAALSSAELRSAAADLWYELFGAPLARIVDA